MNKTTPLPEKLVLAEHGLIVIRRAALRNNFQQFRQYYFKHCHPKEDGIFQKEMSVMLSEIILNRGQKLAIAAPRGYAKSIIVTLEFVIYCICYTLENFIVIISNTQAQAAIHLSHIKSELETNELLIRDFPDICERGKKLGPPRWRANDIITSNNINVIALGTGQQIRGRRNRQFRPGLFILDDIETDESTPNPDSYYKLYDWLTKSVLKAGSSSTNTVFMGTIHHYNSLLAQFTDPKQNPSWIKKIYRAIISFAEDTNLWEKWRNIYNSRDEFEDATGPEAAKAFFTLNQEQMLKGTHLLWPEFASYYDLMCQREDSPISFDSEMQNEPVNPRDCIFNPEEFHYWDDKFQTQEELLSSIQSDYTMFGACDPSMGKDKLRGDYSAIITAVRDNENSIVYVLDADIEIRPLNETIHAIIVHHTKRKYNYFAFEANQFQDYVADNLEKDAQKAGQALPLERITHTTDKISRIHSLQPSVKNGSIQFSRYHNTRLLEQMKYFPKGKHDDGPDALEMIMQLIQEHSSRGYFITDDQDVSPE